MPLRPCVTGCGTLISEGSRCRNCRPQPRSSRSRQTPGRGGGHRAAVFRGAVLRNAGYQCEMVEDGDRCPVFGASRLQAHHVVPIAQGGDPADPRNGRGLCRRHHEIAERMGVLTETSLPSEHSD